MTTWLRFVGASIMGILDPVPSTVPSLMSKEEGAWVRANAWTKGLLRIEDAYPYGFHCWCSCEAGTCHPCASGHHDQCVSADGPRVDENAGTMTDRGGFVVAVIRYGPGQRPCRWICHCTHPANVEPTAAVDAAEAPPDPQSAPPTSRPSSTPAGQLSLFASVGLPKDHADGEAR
ncbi:MULTISPECIES: DUF6248 family natural product biosynthesis protein [unclassified Streptomyces]|uniref:DUF6248 family natural product biosynthesis protein n=1 Tax=unclassified Streptomyces TaxID=2593676 RepID=UPI003654553A